ncbi:MAG: RNA-binding protein [Lentisphaerae bacterium]|nr:RNA-binding protein [Lentisphaerota bacterium]
MSINLYIGNVPFSSTEDDIKDLFSQFGQVARCHLVIDRETNRSRGFAFVEMGSDDEARQAMEKLNGYDIDGRKLVVNEARPREERPRGGGGGGYGDRPSRSWDRR